MQEKFNLTVTSMILTTMFFFLKRFGSLKNSPLVCFFSDIMTSWSKVAVDLEFVVTGGRVKFLSAL